MLGRTPAPSHPGPPGAGGAKTDRFGAGRVQVGGAEPQKTNHHYEDLALLRSEVPLHAGVGVGIEGDLQHASLHRLHRLHLLRVVPRHRCAAEAGRLAGGERTNGQMGEEAWPLTDSGEEELTWQ